MVIARQDKDTMHCSHCDYCVEEVDHHCPWSSKCIAERNKPCFLGFLLLTCALVVYLFFVVVLVVGFNLDSPNTSSSGK